MVVIFLISGHIYNILGNAGIVRISFVDLAVRSLYETVLVDSCIACKRVDQTDVRSLRGLDGAHSSVMRIVYVSNLESGSVSGQTARTKGRQTSLMSQLTKRVVLVHELGQLGRSEELFDSCGNRLDVDQGLRGNVILILGGHTLTNDSLQSGKTDAVLVLKQLTYGTDTTVTQMVDIVVISDAVLQMHVIVDGSDDILFRDMLRNQLMDAVMDGFFDGIQIVIFFQNFFKNRIIY